VSSVTTATVTVGPCSATRTVEPVLRAIAAAIVLVLAVGCDDDDDGSGGRTSASASTTSTGAPSSSSTASGPSSSASTATTSTASSTAASSSTGLFDCTDAEGAPSGLTLTDVVTGLYFPLLVTVAPDDPDRLYIAQQSGEVLIFDGQLLSTPFLNLNGQVLHSGEQGLLGLVFHPDYAQNGRFFVHYSAPVTGASTIMEFQRSEDDPLQADPAPTHLVLSYPTAEPNHNGGALEFGPDGYLYIGLGDGGAQGDPGCDAQNPGNLYGKILRLDVDAAPTAEGYPAAPGNPQGARHYHRGLRNPWRFSFDVCTGDLFIGDVGWTQWEEVDVIADGAGPANMGWPMREAAHDRMHDCPPVADPLTEPLIEYPHADGCSITGGVVYRSEEIPWLRGHYIYGDLCSGSMWSLQAQNGALLSGPTLLAPNGGSVASFGLDGHGNVYVVDLGGRVARLDDASN